MIGDGGARRRRAERPRRAPLPAAGAAVQAGPRARVHADRGRHDLEVAPGVFFPAWTYNGTAPGRSSARPRATRCACASGTQGSHPHTIHFHGIHPSNMDGVFEIVEPGGSFTLRVRGAARGLPPLPLPRDAAQEAHPQGSLRRVHHRPEGAAPARAGARHGDERLRHRRRRREQLLHRQRALVLLRALPDPREALGARADLPREPDRVRPHQLVPPARATSSATSRRARATTGSTRTP